MEKFIPLILNPNCDADSFRRLFKTINKTADNFICGKQKESDLKLQLNYTIEKETHWDKTKINKLV